MNLAEPRPHAQRTGRLRRRRRHTALPGAARRADPVRAARCHRRRSGPTTAPEASELASSRSRPSWSTRVRPHDHAAHRHRHPRGHGQGPRRRAVDGLLDQGQRTGSGGLCEPRRAAHDRPIRGRRRVRPATDGQQRPGPGTKRRHRHRRAADRKPEPAACRRRRSGSVDQPPALTANLAGTVTDDGLPGGAGTVVWSKVSGPGGVTFGDPVAALDERYVRRSRHVCPATDGQRRQPLQPRRRRHHGGECTSGKLFVVSRQPGEQSSTNEVFRYDVSETGTAAAPTSRSCTRASTARER